MKNFLLYLWYGLILVSVLIIVMHTMPQEPRPTDECVRLTKIMNKDIRRLEGIAGKHQRRYIKQSIKYQRKHVEYRCGN